MSQPTPGGTRLPADSTVKPKPASAAAATASSSGAKAATPVSVKEFTVRIPKNSKKMHHVMKFNAALRVDFAQWKNVKMERENSVRDARPVEDETPKFGAGSEYHRELKEELRRKKFGFQARKVKQDAQPWLLKVDGKSGKKFRGIREGFVSKYASFYVFAHAPDGAIEAYPLSEWYNFQPIQRYKALTAEEAEEEFGRRHRIMNHFSLMTRKRLKGDEDGQDDPEEAKLKLTGKKAKEFKISDADDIMMDSDDDSDSGNEEKAKSDDDDAKKKKGGKRPFLKKKKKQSSDDEAFEESDDGDEEGREMDYIESSDSESDPELQVDKEMKSVAEEDGLRKLLDSDEEETEEEKNSDDESSKDEEKSKKEAKEKDAKDKKKLKKKKSKDGISEKEKKESLSDLSSNSSDSEAESKKPRKLNNNSTNNSRSASPSLDAAGPSGIKRKLPTDVGGNSNCASENSNSPGVTPAKKTKYEPSVPSSFAGVFSANRDDNGIREEDVRRYLMRKPMTTTELLIKFKNKKTGVSSDKLIEVMTQILKKINPIQQKIQGKMYFSLKNK